MKVFPREVKTRALTSRAVSRGAKGLETMPNTYSGGDV